MTLSTPIVFGEPHVFGEPSYGRDTDTDGTDGASFPALIASGGFSDIKIVHKRRRNAGAVCRQGDRAARTDRRMSETGPTAAYRQHHDVEAPRVDERHFLPAWRVLTRLDGLLADHAITSAEWHAAADFRELVDQVRCRALTRSSAFGTVRAAENSFRNWGAGDLDASARLRQIRAVLGAWACTLLEAALVRDLSWAALGREYERDPKTARTWVIAAIKALRTV
jgi:hypothetical protein